MIKRLKPGTPPADLQPENERHKKWVDTALAEKDEHKARSFIYRADTVLLALKALYKNKCAYCESDPSAGSAFQVEHYRPAKAVTENSTHPGYYWLAYEWTNLLLSCSLCNSQAHKGNHFPLAQESNRITVPPANPAHWQASHATLLAEEPLLLNPEIDNPTLHIGFMPNGAAKEITERGHHSIATYGLNRQDLKLARKEMVDSANAIFNTQLLHYIKREITYPQLYDRLLTTFDQLRNAKQRHKPYSLFGFCMWQHFSTFFIKERPAKQQKVLAKLHAHYLAQKHARQQQ